MKVTMLAHTTPQSGVAGISMGISKFMYNIALELIKKKHEVGLLVRNDYRPDEDWIKTVNSPKISWFFYPFFLGRMIGDMESDVYHADYVTTGAPLVSKNKRPNVVSLHDVIPFTYDQKDLSVMDRIRVIWYIRNVKKIEKADAVTVLSEHARNEALKYTAIPKENLHVVYAGVDLDRHFPLKKRPHKKIRIGYLGGLDGRKNVGLLVSSFKRIVETRNDVELHVGGGGENLEVFKAMNIKNATFYGKIAENQKNVFLNSLDIFVFPSLMEGFGLPPLEAMACGVPVVASDASSIPEVVGDGGLLSKPTEDAMVKSITRLLDNPSLRKRMARRGLDNARTFTWKRCAEQALEVYEAVGAGRA